MICGLLMAACSNNEQDKGLEFTNDLEDVNGWSGIDHNVHTVVKGMARSGNYISKMDTVNRYGYLFRSKLSDLSDKPLKAVKVAIWANVTEVSAEALLVVAIDSLGKSILWEGQKLNEFVKKTDVWTEVLAEADLSKLKPGKDYVISVFVWNNGKSVIYTDDHRVRFVE